MCLKKSAASSASHLECNRLMNIVGANLVFAQDRRWMQTEELEGIFNRGARIATMGSGQRKVTLSGEDNQAALHTPIAAITYLPKANLDAVMVEKRFGQPDERIREQNTDVEHWLYPALGLDIALSDERKDVLQYTRPSRFENLVAPLKKQ